MVSIKPLLVPQYWINPEDGVLLQKVWAGIGELTRDYDWQSSLIHNGPEYRSEAIIYREPWVVTKQRHERFRKAQIKGGKRQ